MCTDVSVLCTHGACSFVTNLRAILFAYILSDFDWSVYFSKIALCDNVQEVIVLR